MMKEMSHKDMEKVWKQVKKDSRVCTEVMRIVHHEIFLNEPYDKAMARLARKNNVDSLIRIAKDYSISPDRNEEISIREMAIKILGRMNEKTRDENINKALLELAEDKDKHVSKCAVDNLPDEVKEDRIDSLIRDMEKEDDSDKRWDLFIKLYPFMDERVADRLFDICDEHNDAMIVVEVLHYLDKISLN